MENEMNEYVLDCGGTKYFRLITAMSDEDAQTEAKKQAREIATESRRNRKTGGYDMTFTWNLYNSNSDTETSKFIGLKTKKPDPRHCVPEQLRLVIRGYVVINSDLNIVDEGYEGWI